MRVSPDPTRRPLPPEAAVRCLLGKHASASLQALLVELWPLFQDSGALLAIPGAHAKADPRGTALTVAVRADAPAATFVFPRQAFTDPLRALLHGGVPEGDHLVPCDATAHKRAAAALSWGPDLPPAEDGLGWRRARQGRGVAVACLEHPDLPKVLALAILP